MGELMERQREDHRDRWGLAEDQPGPLVATDHADLLRIYQTVHNEMMARTKEHPGLREPDDDSRT